MMRAHAYPIRFLILSLALVCSCAGPRERVRAPAHPPKPPPAAPAPAEKKPVTGIRGSIVLVDERGVEIAGQSRAGAALNATPLKEGRTLEDKTFSTKTGEEGHFFLALREGEYSVEIFLMGFHVERFTVNVLRNEVTDVGAVTMRKLETEGGRPVKGGPGDALPPDEGDVNIQPPVS